MPPITDDIAIENMIASLAGQLVVPDREPFHRVAVAALQGCHGEGAAYRALVARR